MRGLNLRSGRRRVVAPVLIGAAMTVAAPAGGGASPAAAAVRTPGDVYLLAGNGTAGYSGDRGLARQAEFSRPIDVAIDHGGNLVIADSSNNRVRVVAETSGTFYGKSMIAGHVYNLAGTGHVTYRGDGIPAGHANLATPEAVTIDPAGNVVISDTNHSRVRVVAAGNGTFYGQSMKAGYIYTVAGHGNTGKTGNGVPAAGASVRLPVGVRFDAAGNMVISVYGEAEVRVVAENTGTYYGHAMTDGDIYTIAGNGHGTGNGIPALRAYLPDPQYAELDGAGNVLVTEDGNSTVRVIAESNGTFYGKAMTAGDIYTVAGTGHGGFSGDGGPATAARLYVPGGLAFDTAGNLLIADSGNNRIRVVAASSGTFYGMAMTAGHIYTIGGDGVPGFSGDGGPAAKAELHAPVGLAVDSGNDIMFADPGNNRIREIAG